MTDLFRSALAADSARPFVTFYDDATGERVELSVATFDNWVAKTANLFRDGLGAEPGERVAVLLPTHWQTQVVLLACAATGLVAALDGDPADADYVVAGPDGLAAGAACPGDRLALSLRPLGGRFPVPPDGFLDYATEVVTYGDHFVPYGPVPADAPQLEVAGTLRTGAQVEAEARAAAADRGVDPGARILADGPLADWDGLLSGLLVPLVVGGSVVLCRNLDEAAVDDRVRAERVTRIMRGNPPPELSPRA